MSEPECATETRRAMKHGAAVHQLRSMPMSSTSMMRSAKAQAEKHGLGVEGASCSAVSTAVVRAPSNNKHH